MNVSAPDMYKQARSRILLLMLVLGAPLTVCAQSQEPRARFSVEPSDAGTLYGVGIQGEPFKFTAEVMGAKCYELNFGDGESEKVPGDDGIALPSDGRAVFIHPYKEVGNYDATLTAGSESDCELGKLPPVFTLEVQVNPPPPPPQPRPIVVVQPPPPPVTAQAPPPEVAEQWPPPTRPAATVPPAPEKSDTLPWLLLLAAIAILLSRDWGLAAESTDAGGIQFEPRSDRGEVTLIKSTAADAAVSMRVHRDKDWTVISLDNGE